MISEVTAVDVIHDKVQILSILKSIADIDEKGVSNSGEESALVHDGVYRLFRYDFRLVHLLHRK
jgi:hypothetical protein